MASLDCYLGLTLSCFDMGGFFYSSIITMFAAILLILFIMAWTQENLTALDAAIAQGATSVTYGNKTVQYRSLSEMIQLRNMMKQELGLSKSSSQRVFATFNNGLHPENN